jgi:hypothetical protein
MTAALDKRDLCPGALTLAIGVVCLLWAQIYPPRESALPALVGWVTIALALIDIAAQFDTGWGRILRRMAGMETNGERRDAAPKQPPAWARIAIAMLWVVGYGAAIFLFGFMATTPIYVFLYMLLHGRRRPLTGALNAAVVTVAIWITFEYLFHYPLYQGALFGAR